MAQSSMLQARTEFAAALNQIATERGITPEQILETIKTAILAAYKKDHPEANIEVEEGEEPEVIFEVAIDPDTGAIEIYKSEKGERTKVTPPGFGRIAAQTAKQVLLQRNREDEKDAIISEYQDRVGSMMTGMVLRFDGKNVIFDIGRGQGYMPPEDQMRGEFYKLNQRMAIFVKDIRETMRGKTIIVSRAVPELVEELFRREVPEVASGAVKIESIAREPGIRTKIAVNSTQSGVDPVGSCVGQKGVRVQEVINELNNEKIDIIQFTEDPTQFISAALAPAENLGLEINDKKKSVVVTVPDDQLSLAIGRGGQNVRLAAKLTGYKIDIVGSQGTALSVTGDEEFEIDQLGLPKKLRELLAENGITTIHELEKRPELLDEIKALTKKDRQVLQKALEEFQAITTPPAREVIAPETDQPTVSEEDQPESTPKPAKEKVKPKKKATKKKKAA